MPPNIEAEVRLEWWENPYTYPYLRESWVMSRSRVRPVPPGHFGETKRVIGYAVLRADAEPDTRGVKGTSYWHRRVWWLYEDDAGMPKDRGFYGPATRRYPVEAVSPQAVKTARPSVRIHERPTPADLERLDPRLRRMLVWLARRGGRATVREVQRAGIPGLGAVREVLAAAGRLAELSWCWIREETRGRTKQKTLIVEVIF